MKLNVTALRELAPQSESQASQRLLRRSMLALIDNGGPHEAPPGWLGSVRGGRVRRTRKVAATPLLFAAHQADAMLPGLHAVLEGLTVGATHESAMTACREPRPSHSAPGPPCFPAGGHHSNLIRTSFILFRAAYAP